MSASMRHAHLNVGMVMAMFNITNPQILYIVKEEDVGVFWNHKTYHSVQARRLQYLTPHLCAIHD